jgi:para-nitrobenzyl esterase
MTGLVRDEQAYFLPETNAHVPLTVEDFNRYAASFGAEHTQALLAKYPLANYANPSLAEIAMAEGAKACTARSLDRAWSKYAPLYAYEFDDRTAPSYFQPVSYFMGAFHTSELQYIFPMFHGGRGTPHPLNAEQEQLSDTLVGYWTDFARSGAPDHAAKDAKSAPPAWPRYSAAKDDIQILDLGIQKPADGYGKEYDCALWDPILSLK